jgi:hypothetical protein
LNKAADNKGKIMALIPLNKFVTKTTRLNTGTEVNGYATTAVGTSTVYTAPIGVTSIVLMAQISNVTTQTQTVSLVHHRNRPVLADAQGNGAQSGNLDSFLVKDFAIPANDAASLLSGKLIIESLDSIRAYCGGSTTATCQLVLSILETANN